MKRFTIEGLRAEERLAKRVGSYCFVYCGRIYVMDGGTLAHREEEWEDGFGMSSQAATEEETELWRALGGQP